MSALDAPAATVRVDRRRTDTRDRLVAAALDLFGTRGYVGTTVAEIERTCGLRPGSGAMYRHFASKEALAVAAVSAYRDRVAALRLELAAQPPAESAADDLERLVVALAGFLRGEQSIVRLGALGPSLPDAVRAELAAAWDEGYGIVVDLIERRGATVDDPCRRRRGHRRASTTTPATWRCGTTPLDVGADRFLVPWVRRWSAVLAG
ncbi:MAG: helix-turn-helix domain-containing protein [Acidimicrobiales bacterium]